MSWIGATVKAAARFPSYKIQLKTTPSRVRMEIDRTEIHMVRRAASPRKRRSLGAKPLKKLTVGSIGLSSVPEEPGRQQAGGSEDEFYDHVVNDRGDGEVFEDPEGAGGKELRLTGEFSEAHQHAE